MSHNELPGLLLSIFFCVQIPVTVSIPVARDIATEIDATYYKLGYKALRYTKLSIPSAFSIRALAQLEWKIYNEIINYCTPPSNSTSCSSAQLYTQDYEETSLLQKNTQPEADFTKVIAGNMNVIYRMIRRFREYIQQWISYSKRSLSQSQMHQMPMDAALLQRIKGIYNASKGPYRIDMHVATFAIPLTQFQLDLKTQDIAQGIFKDKETGIKLQAIHCLEIGIHSIATGLYPVGIDWLEHALYKIKQGDNTTTEVIVEGYLNQAKKKHDKDWQPENQKDMAFIFYERPLNQTPNLSERKWRKSVTYSRVPQKHLKEKFSSLCNDNQRQVHTPKLFCWQETNIHPFWTIGPLKAELLSTTPDQVIKFHGIIGLGKTTEIQNVVSSDFYPALVGTPSKLYPRVKLCGMCTSLQDYSAIYANLEKIATRVTGLQVQAKVGSPYDPFYLNSYSPGGYNSVHPDWPAYPAEPAAARMATFVLYLDVPEVGGNTVLPRLGVAAKALKGSALLWYNFHSSGAPALKAIHGGCPVVLGDKLIVIKVVAYKAQDHLMCDQDEKAGFDYFGNARSKLRFLKHRNLL